jgi:hypothetical protein
MPQALLLDAARSSPTPWIAAAAGLTGAAVAIVTRRTVGRDDPEAARTRSWVIFAVLMSGAVAMWLLGVFVPGPVRIAHPKYIVFYLACSTVFAGAFRFPKTAGLLVVLLSIVGVTVGYLFSTALRPASVGLELGRVAVYARLDGSMDLEFRSPGRPPLYGRLSGDRLVPVVRSIVFDDLWPGLGSRSWYRLEGITACSASGQGGSSVVVWDSEPVLYERPAGVPELFYAFFEEHAARVPGVRVDRSERAVEEAVRRDSATVLGRVAELREYVVRLRAGAGFELLPVPVVRQAPVAPD